MKKLILISLILFCASPAFAFMAEAEGCGAGSCIDCHSLSKTEADDILKQIEGEVVGVTPADVPGLWRVDMKMQGKVWPLYLDYSKSYLITGNVIQLENRQNLTEDRFRELNPVDITTLPLDDALLMGDPEAKTKVVVFTDPLCPYCSKLHQEMKKALEVRPDIAWLIKLMPVKKGSRELVETILCDKSLEMLETAVAGRHLPPASCKDNQIDLTLQVAANIGLRSTPTLIMPNGRIMPGYKKLDHLLRLIDENGSSSTAEVPAEKAPAPDKMESGKDEPPQSTLQKS